MRRANSMRHALMFTVATLAAVLIAPQSAVAAPPESSTTAARPTAGLREPDLARLLDQLAPTPDPAATAGSIDDDELDRMLCQDLADYDEDAEVRAAAQAALATNDPAKIRDFLDNGVPLYRKAAAERAKIVANDNRKIVQGWAESGTPIVRQRAAAALATKDDKKIADFIAVGKAAADAADAQDVLNAAAQAKTIQARVEQLVAHGGYEVQAQGQAALDSEDPAVIAAFYNTGYQAAAAHDAEAQSQIEAALTARTKAVSDLTDLAQRATRAANAQTTIVSASISATQSLTVSANSMGLVNKYAKQADAIYASDLPIRKAGGATHTADITKLRSDACAEAATTARNADQVTAQAGVAATAAQTLVATGLSHGIEWSEVTQAQGDAGTAAKQAAETACHAAEATEAAAKTLDADHNATVDAANAVKYRQAAEREQAAAEKLAAQAEKLAAAAQAAAADAHAQRLRAEKAADDAWDRAAAAAEYYNTARQQRDIAQQASSNAVARELAAYNAAKRAVDQQNIAIGKHEDAKKAYDDALAAGQRFSSIGTRTKDLIERAKKSAAGAHSKELEAEAAEARALAIETACKHPDNPSGDGCPGTADMQKARADADRLRGDATAARNASNQAQNDANDSSAQADAAAAEAQRAKAAAAAAAAAARGAANEARIAKQDASTALAAAARAIDDATKANNDARAAVNTARSAMNRAAAARSDADLTKQAAADGVRQAAVAAFQARVAGRAALNARVSAAGIADPAVSAIDVASAYADTDNDAAMAIDLASSAMQIGDEQADAARRHADDAEAAAQHAAEMAAKAQAQVKPAYLAAQAAAKAAQRAIAASKVAVDAARAADKDAQATVDAANDAVEAEEKASSYAQAADQMAAQAGSASGVARQAANGARGYANQAQTAADNADKLAGDTEKMRDVVVSISDSMWGIARSMAGFAKTLQETMWKAYDAEQQAAETEWMRWLQDKSDSALSHLPWGGDIAKGAANDLIGTVEGIWYLSNCTVGSFVGTTPAGDEYTVPDVSFLPSADKACNTLVDGLKKLKENPGDLIHWNEWKTNWQKALGMTVVDIVMIVGTDGLAAIGKALASGITKDIAKAGLKDLLIGAAKYGGERLMDAITRIGAVNTARIIELGESLVVRLTLSPEEIAAMAKAITFKGIDAVEQALRDLRDTPIVKGLENFFESCLSVNSFAPDTLVVLADGSRARIADVRIGDRVLATDPQSGRTEARPVTDVFRNQDTALADVAIGSAVLHTTAEHPFWDVTTGTWTDAADLHRGDVLRTANGGRATVTGVRTFAGSATMHNLSVAGLHSYYVLAGRTPVLVHNFDCGNALETLEGTSDAVRRHNEIVDRRWSHSFNEHGAQWFGYADIKDIPKERLPLLREQWKDLVKYVARSNNMGQWTTKAGRTEFHLAQKDGRWFAVQFFLEGDFAGYLATAFVPNARQLAAMKRIAGMK